ncbi:MAG TPA: MmcQ/YjbR family DNA-binding protein [Gemmatimonadales bacterium]|nr:MmcQ/YjbR family DNA-binding protein [Gemmatimonadales bacterium]
MTADAFRRLALGLPETSEGAHSGHPDFRVRGKIFATLAWPDAAWAMVKLTPEEQEFFIHAEPEAFVPVKGTWGRQGSTNVRLKAGKQPAVRSALVAAWRRAAPQRLADEFEPTR